MSKAKSSNWEKAPQCAKFVKDMRAVFGDDVKVLYVKEGSLELGESTDPNRPLSEVRDDATRKNGGAEREAARSTA